LTLVVLFDLQGEQIMWQPLMIAMLAVSILIQAYFNAGLAYWLPTARRRVCRRSRQP
jgi:ACR3 family arsenite transporter